jgi:hypothetical protein
LRRGRLESQSANKRIRRKWWSDLRSIRRYFRNRVPTKLTNEKVPIAIEGE